MCVSLPTIDLLHLLEGSEFDRKEVLRSVVVFVGSLVCLFVNILLTAVLAGRQAVGDQD